MKRSRICSKFLSTVLVGGVVGVATVEADILLGYDFETPLNLENTKAVNGVFITNMDRNGQTKGPVEGPEYLSHRTREEALGGEFAFRFGLNYAFDYRPWNEGKYQKPRSAMTWNYHRNADDTARLKVGREYWLGIAYYFPEDYIFDHKTNKENVFQMHKIDGRHYGESNRYTPGIIDFTLVDVDGNGLCDDFEISLNDYYGSSSEAQFVHHSFKLTRGEWHQIVLHFKFTQPGSADADEGFLEIYRNGQPEPVFSVKGANVHPISTEYRITPNFYKYIWHCRINEPTYPEWKYNDPSLVDHRGDYAFAMSHPNKTRDTGTQRRVDGTFDRYFYIDNIFLGDENSSIEDVAPAWLD